MKKLILSCFILFLTLVSCSPKQENKNKEQVAVSVNESAKSDENISDLVWLNYVGMVPSAMVGKRLEKGSKVIFKNYAGNPPYPHISLVTYNGIDIYLEMGNLSNLEITMIRDDKIIDFDYNHYFNSDTIKVYKECNKGSESFLVSKKHLRFHRIQGINDWLYLTSNNFPDNYPEYQELGFVYEEFGFVYVYDISEKSFYGNIEEDKKSDNYFSRSRVSEYEIIQRYKNIKRYGPLLTINHNNKTVEFWNSFHTLREADPINKSYTLLDYYPDYNEILIRTKYYEGSTTAIFNLESEKSVCSVEIPYFNNSRTYMITMFDRGPWGDASLRIYAINKGLYNTLKEIEFGWQEFGDIDIKNVVWLNDTTAQITLDNSSPMLVEIGKEVKITRK